MPLLNIKKYLRGQSSGLSYYAMKAARLPANEFMRLQSLRSLNILDTCPDERFDCITRFISNALRVPIVGVTFIDSNRIWFKSVVGLNISQMPRGIGICSHAIYEVESRNLNDRIYEVPDTQADDRFFDAPYVTDYPWIRTYMGFVLQSEFGENLGTSYVVDNQPREFTDKDRDTLITLGVMIENLMLGRHYATGIEDRIR